MNLKDELRHVMDFPTEGIDFIDITTVLGNAEALKKAIDEMIAETRGFGDYAVVVGAESRGFIFGTPIAYAEGKAFVPVRKKGKLPAETISAEYDLEYGTDILEIHADAVKPGQKVVVVDDLLATGGTAKANIELVEKLGGEVVGLLYFIELEFLNGRDKIGDYPVKSILKF